MRQFPALTEMEQKPGDVCVMCVILHEWEHSVSLLGDEKKLSLLPWQRFQKWEERKRWRLKKQEWRRQKNCQRQLSYPQKPASLMFLSDQNTVSILFTLLFYNLQMRFVYKKKIILLIFLLLLPWKYSYWHIIEILFIKCKKVLYYILQFYNTI